MRTGGGNTSCDDDDAMTTIDWKRCGEFSPERASNDTHIRVGTPLDDDTLRRKRYSTIIPSDDSRRLSVRSRLIVVLRARAYTV